MREEERERERGREGGVHGPRPIVQNYVYTAALFPSFHAFHFLYCTFSFLIFCLFVDEDIISVRYDIACHVVVVLTAIAL
jgi:hypothetical protein